PEARLHGLRGAPEPHDADGDAAVYQIDQRIQQEAREPRCGGLPTLRPLQFLPDSQEPEDDACRDSWAGYAGLVYRRIDRCGEFRGEAARAGCCKFKLGHYPFAHWTRRKARSGLANRSICSVRILDKLLGFLVPRSHWAALGALHPAGRITAPANPNTLNLLAHSTPEPDADRRSLPSRMLRISGRPTD